MTRPTHRFPLFTARAAVAALALAVGVTSAGVALARPGHHGPGKHGSVERLERGLERLELDDATLEAAYAILDAARESRRGVRVRMREAHDAMRSLLEQDAPDTEAVLAQAETIGALRTEARKQHLATLLEVQALLTPEQRERLHERARQRGPGRRGGCGDRAPH